MNSTECLPWKKRKDEALRSKLVLQIIWRMLALWPWLCLYDPVLTRMANIIILMSSWPNNQEILAFPKARKRLRHGSKALRTEQIWLYYLGLIYCFIPNSCLPRSINSFVCLSLLYWSRHSLHSFAFLGKHLSRFFASPWVQEAAP